MSNFASSIRAHYKSLFNIHFCRTLRHIISQSNRRHYCKRLFYDWRRITTPSKVFHSTEGYCHHFIVVLCKLPVFFSLSAFKRYATFTFLSPRLAVLSRPVYHVLDTRILRSPPQKSPAPAAMRHLLF